MKLYCMCEAQNGNPGSNEFDHQVFGAPNRYCAVGVNPDTDKDVDTVPPVALKTPMKFIKAGVPQVILLNHNINMWVETERPKDYRRHYPNVDFYECPNCHSRIVRE